MKKLILISACLTLCLSCFAQEEWDDIYYNPKTAKQQTVQKKTPKTSREVTIYGGDSQTYYYYPENTYQEDRDVDEYNRFGRYYQSSIDTIGQAIADSQDFVYTQEIQKYYNPTIVVDNSSLLADVLDSSYGNVNIIYDMGYPVFTPWYSRTFPYYGTTWCWNPYWNLGWGYGPGWSWSWGWGGWYDPWYAWGPSWGWSWGWSPTWPWGWGSAWGGYWANSTPRPGNTVHNNWAHNTRPGTGTHRHPGVTAGMGHTPSTRPGNPSYNGTTHRPGTAVQPGTSYTHRGYNSTLRSTNTASGLDTKVHRPTTSLSTTRPSSTTTTRPSTNTTRPGVTNVRPANTMNLPTTTTTRPSTNMTRPNTTTTRPSQGTTHRSSGFSAPSSPSRSSGGGFRSGGGTRGGGGSRGGGRR